MQRQRGKDTFIVSAAVRLETKAALRKLAYEREITLSVLLREIIERALAEKGAGDEVDGQLHTDAH